MMNAEEIEKLIDQRVAAALAAAGIPIGTKNSRQSENVEKAVEKPTEVRTLIIKREREEIREGSSNPSPDKRLKVAKIQDERLSKTSNYAGKHPYCRRCGKHHSNCCTIVCRKCKQIGHKADNCGASPPKPRVPTSTRYAGKLPWCQGCEKHHKGVCMVVCKKCKKTGHKAKNCRIPIPTPPVPKTHKMPLGNCFQCGEFGHYKHQCPENGSGARPARSGTMAVTTEDAHQDPGIVTGKFPPNVCYTLTFV